MATANEFLGAVSRIDEQVPLGMDLVAKRAQLENTVLEGMIKRRTLSQPTSIELQQEKEKYERAKYIFGQLYDFWKDPNVDDATRGVYEEQMKSHVYSLPQEFQSLLRPLFRGSPLDERQQKAISFDKMFGHTKPSTPTDAEGNVLPINEETESRWAWYQLKNQDYEYKKSVAVFGAQNAEKFKPPKFVQPLPMVGEGENAREGNFWYLDGMTDQLMSVSAGIRGTSLKKAEEWGYTLADIQKKGVKPIAPPIVGTYGGGKFQVTPVVDLATGKEAFDIISYGGPDDALKALPAPLVNSMVHLKADTDIDDINNAAEKGIVSVLREYESGIKKGEFTKTLEDVRSWIKNLFPNANFELVYDKDQAKANWFGWGNKIKIPGTSWSIIPQAKRISLYGASPLGVPTQGMFIQDESGKVYDDSGNLIPQAEGAEEGQTIPDMIIPESVPLKEEGDISDERVGDVIMELMDPTIDREELRNNVRAVFAGNEHAAARKFAWWLAKEFGNSTVFWMDKLINDPIEAMWVYANKGVQGLLEMKTGKKRKGKGQK